MSCKMDRFFRAYASAVNDLKQKMEYYQQSITRVPKLNDTMIIIGIALGATGLSHLLADLIAPWLAVHAPWLEQFSLTSGFFWLVVMATTIGMILSGTRARNLEGVGASRIGSVFLYVLVATIGMQMNVLAVFENPGLFLVGLIWIGIHGLLLFTVGRLIKAPFFFLAVGSQANVGGAASAPIVAAAFHPSLAPVGVLLAVLGYALEIGRAHV